MCPVMGALDRMSTLPISRILNIYIYMYMHIQMYIYVHVYVY